MVLQHSTDIDAKAYASSTIHFNDITDNDTVIIITARLYYYYYYYDDDKTIQQIVESFAG